MASNPLRDLMQKHARPRVMAAERRSAKFGIPPHEAEAARSIAFKRGAELMEWAMSEFIRAGHDGAARAAWRAIDYAERAAPTSLEKPQEELRK